MSGGATAFAEAGHYVDALRGKKTDVAIDAVHQAMGEHGAFSPEALAAMAKANDLRGGRRQFPMPDMPAQGAETAQFQTHFPERVSSTLSDAQDANLPTQAAEERGIESASGIFQTALEGKAKGGYGEH